MNKKQQCELCEKNSASVHYTEIADAEVSKLFICRTCAESRGLLEAAAPSLEALMSSVSKPTRRAATPHVHPCPKCGLEFADFQTKGRLGCPDCYAAFENQLKPLLRQIHADWRHAGKQPQASPTGGAAWARVETLQKQLDAAIKSEHYERAARLRDEIQTAKQALEGSPDARRDRDAAGEDPSSESSGT